MAIYTKITVDEARALGADVGIEVVSSEGMLVGSVNTNYELRTTDNRRFFLRIYEESDVEGARGEHNLLRWLAERGVAVVAPLQKKNSDDSILNYGDKAAAIFRWADGQMRCQASVSANDMRLIGQALARIHLAGMPSARPSRFSVERLIERCRVIETAREPELAKMADVLREHLQQISRQRDSAAPVGLCHGDLFRDNVLWVGNTISALLDFESAALGTFMFDLGTTMLAWCYSDKLEPELVRALGEGYELIRPVAGSEKDALWAETCLSALRFSTTRITDYAMRASEGGNITRDWRRFWARYEIISSMGTAGLNTMLFG